MPRGTAGFPWSECQVRKLATSHCTIEQMRKQISFRPMCIGNAWVSVQSPLVVLLPNKVRKGGDFFYGKSSNENHTQGAFFLVMMMALIKRRKRVHPILRSRQMTRRPYMQK